MALNVAISILTFNRVAVLRELLDSLTALNHALQEVIVVDNCSDDDTGEMVKSHGVRSTYIRLDRNIGAAARNHGLKMATADIVVTLDDDIIGLDDGAIERLTALFESNPRLGAVNFEIRDYFTGERCNWVHHKIEENWADKEFPTYEITEGAVAFRREAIEKAGYYADDFFLSHEGPDLAYRIMDEGYEIYYCGRVTVRHRHENTGRKAWYNYYYDTRNLFWLAARNLPVPYALRYVSRGVMAMLLYSLRDRFFIYWLRGVRDGIAGITRAAKKRKVLRPETMRAMARIDEDRPDMMYYMKKRLFQKSARL
ncbi:MAG: Poly-beta-1,6-N-acetyl-D-glucosamine synthase [Syntrophus sp. PtaU1.Bin208]|nr:MAG: Poly-beta-1,6-N-acetyl-D-glucosamine synthase [Syntrophus sp. PtaU1.Bin208]